MCLCEGPNHARVLAATPGPPDPPYSADDFVRSPRASKPPGGAPARAGAAGAGAGGGGSVGFSRVGVVAEASLPYKLYGVFRHMFCMANICKFPKVDRGWQIYFDILYYSSTTVLV